MIPSFDLIVVAVSSPVFAPEILEVPETAKVGVAEPDITTLLTEVGVILFSDKEIAGVVVEVAIDPEIPFAVVKVTFDTVPVAAFVQDGKPLAKVRTCPSIPFAKRLVVPTAD